MGKCLNCGKEFFRKYRPNQKFCSCKCLYSYLNGKSYEQLFGKDKAESIRKKQSVAVKGKKRIPHSEERRKKISIKLKGRTAWNKWNGMNQDIMIETEI